MRGEEQNLNDYIWQKHKRVEFGLKDFHFRQKKKKNKSERCMKKAAFNSRITYEVFFNKTK